MKMKARTAGKLKTYPTTLENRAVIGLEALNRVAVLAAKQLAPKYSGLLASKQTSTEPRAVDFLIIQSQVGNDVYYGIFQELGTEYMEAQPYLRPTAELIAKLVGPVMREAIVTGKVTKI